MGARGQKSKTTKTSQSTGRRFRGEPKDVSKSSDDFSRRGIGDKIDVIGQRKRGRKKRK